MGYSVSKHLAAGIVGATLVWIAVPPLFAAAEVRRKQAAPASAAPQPTSVKEDARAAFFEARVRPLLVKHCTACHSQKIAQGGLRLDHPAALLKGGDTGPAVVPGKPAESRLIEAVRYTNPKLQMPPGSKLTEAEVQVLTTWVEQGAVVPQTAPAAPGGGPMSLQEGKRFWAFRPLMRPPAPKVRNTRWPLRPIDRFILARLEAAKRGPSPRADRRTLIRRAYFDLIGLPPTPEEVDAFVRDPAPDAYARLVDRLLASPHYGERWGRHWLDLVRYCDVPESWAVTEAQPWLYRDWVVRALNEDVPYHEFIRRQLAADEMPGLPTGELAALGFLGLSPSYWKELKLAPDVIKIVVAEEWEERINTVTGTVLGLTVACARCHDHKFDPVSTQDYYALAGIFASTKLAPRPLLPGEAARQVVETRERVSKLEAEAKRLDEEAGRTPARAAELKAQAGEARRKVQELRQMPGFDAPTAYAVETASLDVLPDGPDRTRLAWREGTGQNVPMQVRGNPTRPGPVVPRRFLAVLSPGTPAPFSHGSGRRDLADAMFREGAPLAARVIVNRVWKHHFGRGLVETPSNFGVQGDRPTHPELLDDLAARFIQAGWSLKWLHRELMLSATYQQASDLGLRISNFGLKKPQNSGLKKPVGAKPNPQSQIRNPQSPNPQSVDPENRLLGRMPRRRLEVEAWRDSILAAAGTLDRKLGGAPQELSTPAHTRRTLYGTVKRRELDDLLRLYDFPDPTAHSPARFHTTTPLQQLYVLNSDFIGRQAGALVKRIRTESPASPAAQVERAYRLLYGRAPEPKEAEAALRFLGESPSEAVWQQYAEVLLASNELMFVD